MKAVQSLADSPSQPLGSPSSEETAKQEPSKERVPIVWKGKAKDDAIPSKSVDSAEASQSQPSPEPKPLQRLKPNAAFLLNVVADAQRGNERLGAEDATNASLTVLGQAVSAGIRPQLDRTQEAGGNALRAAVLSVAQQQKLATCTALLREVAMVYGFALHIDPEVGEAAAEAGGGAVPERKEGYTPVQPLRARLNVASQGDAAALEEAVTASYALARLESEPKSAPCAPAIDVRANRLAGTAFGAIGLSGAAPPPLAVRKLQRAKARQKDRTGIFAASDATRAESSQDIDNNGLLDAELAEEDHRFPKQSPVSMPGPAAALRVQPLKWAERPSSAPLQNGHPSVSNAMSEASSAHEHHELAPSRLPKPRAARAGSALGLPSGRARGEPSRMPVDEADDADLALGDDGSPEPARKRPRSSVRDSAAAHARGIAAQNGVAQGYVRSPRSEVDAFIGRALEESPDESEFVEARDLETSDEEAPQQQPVPSVRSGMRADTAVAKIGINGQVGSLRSRLGNSTASQRTSAVVQRAVSGGLRTGQGTQDALKKGAKSSRGLFGAALTGLQR